ncbi:MAG: ABC transporter permease [Deltaproteobacteria bacterium]|nr:ABC transporter permease [Deltaproteobacteria bacterium]
MRHLLGLVAFRHLVGAPLRSTITILGIALGVASVVAMSLVNDGILRSVRRGIEAVAGRADLEISAGAVGLEESALERVRAVPGVSHAAPVLEVTANVTAPRSGAGDTLLVLGLDTLGDSHFTEDPLEGGKTVEVEDPIAFLNAPDSLLLSQSMARRLGLRVGGRIEVVTAAGVRPLTVRGLLPEGGLTRAFGGDVGVMDIYAMQIAFHREGRFDRIQVALRRGTRVPEARRRLASALGPGADIETPKTRTGRQEQMLFGVQAGTMIAGAVALLVGMFLIYNTVSIAVVERRREIGTLRALGASRREVLGLFAIEAALIGCLGGLGGVGIGIVLSRQLLARVSESISALYLRINANEVSAPPIVWALGALLGLVAAVGAGFVPARAAAKVNPVESLRRGSLTQMPRAALPIQLAFAGALVMGLAALAVRMPRWGGAPIGGYLAAFLVLIGSSLLVPLALRLMDVPMRAVGSLVFGAPGRLAADNLARAPLRTSVTVAALMTGVAMTVNVASFVQSFRGSIEDWLRQAVPADLFVNSTSSFIGVANTPLRPDLRPELLKIRGVEDVDPVRMARISYRGRTAFLLSLEKAVYRRHGRPVYIEGSLADDTGDAHREEIGLSENLARKWGLHRGDTVTLRSPSGPKSYRVAAIIVDYTSDAGTMILDRSAYIRDFGDDLVDSFDVYLTAQGKRRIDAIRREILRKFGRRYDLRVKTNLELREQIMSFVNQMFQVMRAMELVALLIAVLGVANSLIASVLDRTRELGILRAIGASRGQVLGSVLAEAGFIGLYASLLGAPAGALLGWLTIRVINSAVSGWVVPFSFAWGGALQTAVLVTVAALVAGIWPSRNATRVQPIVALRAE